MRFHVVSLPQIGTTKDYYTCGFVPAIVNFCKMMKALGHTVFLYTSDENTAPCDEAVACITKEEQKKFLGDTHYVFAPFEASAAQWGVMNERVIKEIGKRKQARDFICSIGGGTLMPIAEAHPDLLMVEYMVGYLGVFADNAVFCSHSWRQFVYGHYKIQQPRYYHETIPLYYDLADFKVTPNKKPYLLYCGRMVPLKGLEIARETAKRSGMVLKMVGPGKRPNDLGPECEFIGEVTNEQRNQLMADARAVLVPTMYNEPFGSVVVEAQLCGTPVITTNWGAFPELVQNGVNGFRCNMLAEFASAVEQAKQLDGWAIRENAMARYSLEAIAPQYQSYFNRLLTLWGKGWYS